MTPPAATLSAAAMIPDLIERHGAKLRALFFLLVAFTIVMALLPKPPGVIPGTLGDKVEHMIAFTVLSACAFFAFPNSPPLRLIERLVFLGAAIEVLQSIPVLHRDTDVNDWVADSIAVVVVIGLLTGLRAIFRRMSG